MTTTINLDHENLINELRTAVTERDQKIIHLEEQLDWFKRQIFGKKSERIVRNLDPGQLLLPGFENFEAQEPEKQPVSAHQRCKPNRNGQDAIAIPPDLPVEKTVLDVPDEEKICKETGEPLVKIGEEITRKLAHKPGSYYIKEIIRPKYAHPKAPETGILTAALPDALIPKCRADESLLAEIVTRKFADHLPLYRIAESMMREHIQISHKLLSQWVIRCGMALKPLYEIMTCKILNSNNIFIDESPVKLQAKDRCKTAYMWVVVGGDAANPPYRIYDFRENRSHDHVLDILKEYRGGLHSDKYGAYVKLAEKKIITWFPCWGAPQQAA